MRLDVIAAPIIPAAPATASVPTDAEPLADHCALCGQPMDPEPDGSEPVCTDCLSETTATIKTTKATKTTQTTQPTKRREPRC